MQRCISVSFEFKGKEFYAIVRRREIQNRTFYKIRIMNYRLDALVHKSNANVIKEVDGRLLLPQNDLSSEAVQIQLSVAKQLSQHLSQEQSHRGHTPVNDFRLLTPF